MTVATALWRRAHGQEVSIVDPWGYIKQNFPKLYDAHPELFESHGLNVLTGFDPGSDTFNDDMADLAEQLLPRGGESNPYWSLAGQALSTGALSAIRATPVYGAQSSLVEFRDMIGQAPEALAEVCKGLVALFGTDRPEIAACLSEFVAHSAEDRERNSIRRVVQANTRWIDSKAIRADMTKNRPIDFASYKQKPKTCYFVIPPGRLRTHSAWLRLMLTAAVLPMMASTEDSKVPVLLMLDEAGALGNIPVIGGNISQIRQFGLKVWSVFQSLDILQETYPKEWKSFLGTADIKVVMSPQEAETPEYFSKLKGEKLFRHWTTSTSRGTSSQIGFQGGRISQMLLHNLLNQGTSENVSTGETFQKEPRIRVDQIAAMNADEGLIFAKRGMVYKTILPQPHLVDDAREGLAQARALIEGKPFPGLTALKRLSTMAKGAAKPAA
jgi:type IV secretory pathway TraG/TraD family ATPase VirD4